MTEKVKLMVDLKKKFFFSTLSTTQQTDRQTEKPNRLTNILEKSWILQVTRKRRRAEHDTCKIHKTKFDLKKNLWLNSVT